MSTPDKRTDAHLASERSELLERIDAWLEAPMVVLGFV